MKQLKTISLIFLLITIWLGVSQCSKQPLNYTSQGHAGDSKAIESEAYLHNSLQNTRQPLNTGTVATNGVLKGLRGVARLKK